MGLRIQYMSDLHLEFDRPAILDGGKGFPVPDKKGDVLVLAGDIDIGTKGADFANRCGEVFDHVILLFGNHEFYHNDINKVREEMGELLASNVHLLDPGYVDIEGVRFVGGTLWSTMGDDGRSFYEMNDSRIIHDGEDILSLERVREMYTGQLSFIEENLSLDLVNVVVTHHAPSIQMCDLNRYGKGYMNTGYATDTTLLADMEDLITLWISGHTHAAFDKNIDGVRCVSNCRGYAGYELTQGFDPNKVVEII